MIGIIAVLIAILLPVLSKARAAANRTACLSNVRQLYVGIMMYCDENRDWFPTCAMPADGAGYMMYPDDWLYWQASLRNIDDSPIARCLNLTGDRLRRVLRCPADALDDHKPQIGISAGQGAFMYSYGLNGGVGWNITPPLSWRTKRSMWRRPAEKILFAERRAPGNAAWSPTCESTHRHGEAMSTKRGTLAGINASAVFFDGHVMGVDDDLFWGDLSQLNVSP